MSPICTICLIGQCIEGIAVWDRFPVAPSNYIKDVRALYRQRTYYYLVQFSGMLHPWLQRYHTRIRTLRSSLVLAEQVSVTVSVPNEHPASMHNQTMNIGLMQIFTPLSLSLEIFCPVITKIKYMYTTMRTCTDYERVCDH